MKISPIDLNLLMALDAITTTRSVSKAAERLGLSKPAMSHALSRLRTQLGDPLLVRAGQRWQLTDRAEALGPRARAVLEEAQALLRPDSSAEPAAMTRDFHVHATDHVLSLIGVPLGHAVSHEAPGVGLRFLPIQAEDAPLLRAGSDLAIGVFPGLPPEFRTQHLFDDRFACVVRKANAAVGARLTLQTYLALPHVLVAPRGRAGGTVDQVLRERGLSRRVKRSVPYFLSALDLISQSDCIVTLSERLARVHAERFGLRVLAPPLPLPVYGIRQVWHPRVDADPGHRWLRGLVLQTVRQRLKPLS